MFSASFLCCYLCTLGHWCPSYLRRQPSLCSQSLLVFESGFIPIIVFLSLSSRSLFSWMLFTFLAFFTTPLCYHKTKNRLASLSRAGLEAQDHVHYSIVILHSLCYQDPQLNMPFPCSPIIHFRFEFARITRRQWCV